MIYIALLRGINVGGHNKIRMAELKQALEKIGLDRVQTYIQSGNVLFVSKKEEGPLRQQIEEQIRAVFGISIHVVLRTKAELERIIAHCPFSETTIAEAKASSAGESLYVSLLLETPPKERIERLAASGNGDDEYRIEGRDVYLLFRHSIRNAKLAGNVEKLGVPATVRNWNTINKLAAMAEAMGD